MKKFNYEARDQATQKIVKSSVQAESENSAAKLLVAQGFSPLNIHEVSLDDGFFARIFGRITIKDKIVFTRQLATLIGAGLPLAQALSTVLEQTENKKMQDIVQNILVSVEGGKSLSSSFAKFPEIFDRVFLALVRAGEISGTLDDALTRVAAQQEKDAAIVSRIRSAMMYPMIVLVVMLLVMVFMSASILPQVATLYEGKKLELPFLTAALIAMINFLQTFWWIVLIAVGLMIYFGTQYLRTESGQKLLAGTKLNIPIFGKMFRKLYMARFSRTSQTLLNTGVSMLDTLGISGFALNNVIVESSISRASEKVKGGKALSEALKNEEYILSLVPQMIKIGEQSGKIDDMLGKVAQVYEDELEEEIKNISTVIEPVLMVILAIMAGGLIGAILYPIYNFSNAASGLGG